MAAESTINKIGDIDDIMGLLPAQLVPRPIHHDLGRVDPERDPSSIIDVLNPKGG